MVKFLHYFDMATFNLFVINELIFFSSLSLFLYPKFSLIPIVFQ